MTNGGYQVGKMLLSVVADTMGAAKLRFNSCPGFTKAVAKAINELYGDYNTTFVGSHVGSQESLNSSRPLTGVADRRISIPFAAGHGVGHLRQPRRKAGCYEFHGDHHRAESGIIDGADASTLRPT